MEIINYSSKYDEDIKNLLVELQEYIAEIDREKYNILTPDYREKYFEKTIKEVNKYEGKIFLAKESDAIVGLIIGVINNELESTYDFSVPKRGRVIELVVSNQNRSNGIGKQLLNKMENYFKEVGCKGVLIRDSTILCDIHELAEIIHANNIVDKRMRKQHVKGIRTKVNHFKELEKNGICPKCGNALVERNGKYGKFIGCSHYPKCKYIKK